MTDEESKKDAMTFSYGFEKGQTHERHQIAAWLRKNGKPQIADAIEAKEHLK